MSPQSSFTPEQKAEIKAIVHEALVEFFKGFGPIGKNVIVTTAVVLGSITIIFGGVKTLLTWIGFSYIK